MLASANGASPGRLSIAICGSGNGAHAVAVVASQHRGCEIDWLAGTQEKARCLRDRLTTAGLRSTGKVEARAGRIRTISADPAEIIPFADIVLIVVPAFGHAAVLGRIAPYLTDTALLGCMPARAGFEFDADRAVPRNTAAGPVLFGLESLPWSTRVTALGESVHIGAVKREVHLAALPREHGRRIAAQLTTLIGTRITASDSFLGLTLSNPGQFIHPGLMYGHFRSWSGQEYDEQSVPMLYAQASDETGEIVERLSREAIAVARAIDAGGGAALGLARATAPVHDWLRASYGNATDDTRTVATCLRTGPIQARRAPMREGAPGRFTPDFGYRYLSEDVPFGLVATRALAQLADVPTPTIDEVIRWAQSVMGRSYLVGDELAGADVAELPVPQNHGVLTVSELVDWYSQRGGVAGSGRRVAVPV